MSDDAGASDPERIHERDDATGVRAKRTSRDGQPENPTLSTSASRDTRAGASIAIACATPPPSS